MLKIQWWALRTCLPNTCVARNRFTGRRASRGVQLGVSIYPSRLSLYIYPLMSTSTPKSQNLVIEISWGKPLRIFKCLIFYKTITKKHCSSDAENTVVGPSNLFTKHLCSEE